MPDAIFEAIWKQSIEKPPQPAMIGATGLGFNAFDVAELTGSYTQPTSATTFTASIS